MDPFKPLRQTFKILVVRWLAYWIGESPQLDPAIRFLRSRAPAKSSNAYAGRALRRFQNNYERRLVPPLFVGVGLLIAPLFLVALVVTWPDVFSPMLVSGTISSGIAMIGGFSILLYRRLRLDDEVMVIMGTSTVLALSLVLPAALAGAASPFLAAALVYGSCLAFFVMGGSAVYIGSVVTRQKYHEIGA